MIGSCDPWVILGYVLCAATVVFCCAYAWIKRNEKEDEEDEE